MEASKQVAQAGNTPASIMTAVLSEQYVRDQLARVCAKNPEVFAASILDTYTSEKALQNCHPKAVAVECLKAAVLNLPLSRSLGFAYVVPYKGMPTFVVGYKGMIQLAMRTGAYRSINAGPVYEGEFKKRDRLTGNIDISGDKVSDTVVGYFAHFEMINGFTKTLYMTKEEAEAHGKRFSKTYNNGPWKTDFDAMATKTVIRQLLSKYGMMSIEIQRAVAQDGEFFDAEYREHANATPLPMPSSTDGHDGGGEVIDMETGEVTDHLVDANKMTDGDSDPGPQEEQQAPPPFAV